MAFCFLDAKPLHEQYWCIVNCNISDRLQRKFNQDAHIFTQEDPLGDAVCQKLAILFRPQIGNKVVSTKCFYFCSCENKCFVIDKDMVVVCKVQNNFDKQKYKRNVALMYQVTNSVWGIKGSQFCG